jgi:hypothetical protein
MSEPVRGSSTTTCAGAGGRAIFDGMGLYERVTIGIFLAWMFANALDLLRR